MDRTDLTPGTYQETVIIRSTNEGGSETIEITMEVNNEIPVASFAIDPTTGNINTNFSFDASTSTDNNTQASELQVRWQFEAEGAFTNWTTTKTAEHQYSEAGDKTITLEVKDTDANIGSVTQTLVVTNVGVPLVTTNSAQGTGQTTATIICTVEDDGGSPITARGVCYGNSYNPTTNETAHSNSETGQYTINLDALNPGTTYHVRAYADNSGNRAWGDDLTFSASSNNAPTVETGDYTNLSETSVTCSGQTYYYNAYALNSSGHDFGTEASFTTLYLTTTTPTSAWTTGTSAKIEWETNIDGSFKIELLKGGVNPITIVSSTSQNPYTWLEVSTELEEGSDYSIKITSLSTSIVGVSNDFTIEEAPSITVTSPNGGEEILIGEDYEITWNTNISGNVNIYLYKNGTQHGSAIVNGVVASLESYTWEVPAVNMIIDDDYRIKIESVNNSGINDLSEEFLLNNTSATTVIDYDGNVYDIIQIGEQWWMAENLKVTKKPNGIGIDSYYYENNETYLNTYGRLYKWEVANQICPNGWHLPNQTEWETLSTTAGGMSIAGKNLKTTGTTYWDPPSNGTDLYGFSALPGGRAYENGNYYHLTEVACFWSSDENNSSTSWYYEIHYDSETLFKYNIDKARQHSVRCIQD